MAYQYLFEPEIQYQTKDGRNNTAGFLRVYLAATDDPATTYSDFGGTRNPQDIILDDDGRAVVIVDDSKAYRLEVYDSEGMLQFTCQPITAVGGGSGSANIVQVVSTDGTVSVTRTAAAGIITYDLSTAFEPEAARWARRTGTSESLIGDEDWHELGTFAEIGSTAYFNGWKLSKDCAYDLAASMEMPAGYDGAINTISVKFVVEKDGVLQDVQFGHVDPTTNMDRVSFEYKGAGQAGERINARLFYRTRQDMPIALESEVFYNEEADSVTGGGGLGDLTAGDYIEITEDHVINATGIQPEITWSYDNTTISAINGSAVGRRYDGIYPIVVDNNQNTVAVDHTGLAVDETMTAYNSADHIVIGVASGQFQPSGSYLSSNALDGISGAWNEVSAKLDSSASGQFYPSGNPSGFITGVDLTPYQLTADMSAYAHESSLSAKLDASASGEFYSTSNPSGFLTAHQSLAGYATESYVDSAVSGKLDVTASSQFLTSLPDDLAYTSDVASAVSGKMDKSESSSFYPMDSNPSGYLTAHQSLAGYATETYVDSAVSGKLDATAYDSAEFYTTSNPSGFIDAASASAIASAYQVVSATATQLNAGTAYVTSINETPISAARAGNAANASLANSAWYDGTGRLISALPDEATVSGIASAYAESAASSKQDNSAMSAYALSADVSGVIDTVSSNSASWAGGITGDYLTSKVGSGQATLSTAFQDGMEKRPSLVISAERSAGAKMYPRMMVTDWNGTTGDTHSGMLLANAFEFYICPQSARGQVDPSGLVQSRLDASQLQFNIDSAVSSFTRSSEFTRSGMRLGKSANTASWVSISGNGNSGGFITLDDGSGTSGRIVASSIPYWNDKLDGSASSSYYTTANESGYVDSAYVESQVSGVIDTVSSNSASWAGGGGVDSATVSAIASAYAESAASGKQASGNYISAAGFGQAIRGNNTAEYLAFGDPSVTPVTNRHAGIWLTGQFGTAYYKDNELNLNRNNMKIAFNVGGGGPKISAMALSSLHSYMYLFASGNNSGTYSETGITFKDSGNNIVALYDSATYGNITSVYDTVSANSASWGGGGGGIDSATCSAIASSYAESATSGKVDQSAYDNLYSAFTALNDLISQYSGYFSSISSKVDNSAIGVIE